MARPSGKVEARNLAAFEAVRILFGRISSVEVTNSVGLEAPGLKFVTKEVAEYSTESRGVEVEQAQVVVDFVLVRSVARVDTAFVVVAQVLPRVGSLAVDWMEEQWGVAAGGVAVKAFPG